MMNAPRQTRLSVNINKIATLRNARGGNIPDLLRMAKDAEHFGAQGITVHPRPDERHITYKDVRDLKKIVTTEFNIEGNPTEQKFVDLILEVLPEQVTLVPDVQGQLTSNHGWDTLTHQNYLQDIIGLFKSKGIRTSIFVDAQADMIAAAKTTGTDRVELYTESYAHHYSGDKHAAVAPFVEAGELARKMGIGLNAGHDLNLDNLAYFVTQVPDLLEVSIGHALVSDALYYGWDNTIKQYLQRIQAAYI
jgi:pyridoxine 5-phosphate synthase